MYILDTLSEISFYRVGLMFKSMVTVVCIFVPIMITLMCMIDVYQIVYKPDEARPQIKKIVDRVIAGLIVFIIPSILNYSMSLVNGYKKDTLFKYYEGTSKEKIEQLKVQYEKEQVAERNKREAEYKEAGKKLQNEEAKIKQQKEEIFKEWQQNKNNNNNNANNNGSNDINNGNNNGDSGNTYSGDTNSNGSYGSLRVENGVFIIPNRRATSDSDIPKQSGPYGVNPIFGERLTKFINAASQAGYKITVTSGWRSYSSQRRLWDSSSRSCSTRSKWVACPGGSRHGFGIAADLKFNGSSCSGNWDCNAAAKWAHANAGNFGLKFRMSWEPWHIEPAQVQGGSFGSCNAKC